jgi:hypothetical protein
MAKKAKPPQAKGVAAAALSTLLGAGRANPFSAIATPQNRLNEIRPTPLVVPKGKGKKK